MGKQPWDRTQVLQLGALAATAGFAALQAVSNFPRQNSYPMPGSVTRFSRYWPCSRLLEL
jgi:hypothetical protein